MWGKVVQGSKAPVEEEKRDSHLGELSATSWRLWWGEVVSRRSPLAPFLIPTEMPSSLILVASHTGEDSVPIAMHHFESHYTEAGHSDLYFSKGDARLSSLPLQDLREQGGLQTSHACMDSKRWMCVCDPMA